MIREILTKTWRLRYSIDKYRYHSSPNVEELKEELISLRDSFKGKPLIIVGNGPSLNKTPLEKFKEIGSIGMNKIDLYYERSSWRPTLVVCANSMVVKQHFREFQASKIPVWLAYKTRFSIPLEFRGGYKYFSINPSYDFSNEIVDGVGAGETVTYTALQFAYYMGASPVILFGVDHNFDTKSEDKLKYVKQSGNDMNHFHKDYFKSGSYWGIPDLEQSEWLYQKCKKKFEEDGRVIYDATIGGKLDIFEKITVEEAIDICRANNDI